jgi:hypothetical protein
MASPATSPNSELADSGEDARCPPVDGGKAAWLFLAGAFAVEARVGGIYSRGVAWA